jgi:hypothetical protein
MRPICVLRYEYSFSLSDRPPDPTLQDNLRRTPTESEEDVVADRSTDDPLPPGKHNTIRMPAGDAQPKPTESEEDVVADRSNEDPLRSK